MSALTYERALERIANDIAWEIHTNKEMGHETCIGADVAKGGRYLSIIYGLPMNDVLDELQRLADLLLDGPRYYTEPKLEVNAIVKYIGPSTGELEHGEDVRICNLRHSNSKELTWCSNMNMPLCGAFSGVIPRDMLEAY